MLIFPGSVALSEFRRNKLLSALQAIVPTITAVQAEYVHFAHNCGLTMVERIERGIAYDVQTPAALSEAERLAIAALLHDRMTEMVLTDLQDAVVLFSEAEPAALRYVDISNDPKAALANANVV